MGMVTFVTYLIAYYCATDILKAASPGHLFAIFYVFASYRLTNMAIRFATGEFLAMTFLPLVFYGFYQIMLGNKQKWPSLALGMTLVIYSHVISVYLTVLVLALMWLTGFIFTKQKLARLWALIKSALLTLGLSAFYILPMLEQTLTRALLFPPSLDLGRSTYPIQDIFWHSLRNDFRPYTPGLLMLLLAILFVIRCWKWRWLDAYLLIFVVLIFLATTDIPSYPALIESFLLKVQFMWRLNAYLIVLLAFLVARSLVQSKWLTACLPLALALSLLINFQFLEKAYPTLLEHEPAHHITEISRRQPWEMSAMHFSAF